jgi:hypothetical protein
MRLVSDNGWRVAKNGPPGWDTPAFDDAGWDKAIAVAKYGDLPWGKIDQLRNEIFGPQSAGIPGVVRVIYVPENEAVVVSGLDRNVTYSVTYFDPVSGVKTPLPQAHSNDSGLWTCLPPDGCDHDWVLVLDEKGQPVR